MAEFEWHEYFSVLGCGLWLTSGVYGLVTGLVWHISLLSGFGLMQVVLAKHLSFWVRKYFGDLNLDTISSYLSCFRVIFLAILDVLDLLFLGANIRHFLLPSCCDKLCVSRYSSVYSVRTLIRLRDSFTDISDVILFVALVNSVRQDSTLQSKTGALGSQACCPPCGSIFDRLGLQPRRCPAPYLPLTSAFPTRIWFPQKTVEEGQIYTPPSRIDTDIGPQQPNQPGCYDPFGLLDSTSEN